MKYKDWMKNWLEKCIRQFVKERTYRKYRALSEGHILPALGEYETEELTTIVLQSFVSEQMNGYATNTVNGVISLLQMSLKQAVKMGVARVQYADSIVRPRQNEKKVECFSKSEQRKIEAYAVGGKTQWIGILICLYTGLRIGELMALTPSDVNLSAMQLTVSKSCHDSWVDGAYVKRIDAPKTDASERMIPIPRAIMPYVKTLKKSCKGKYLISNGVKDVSVRSYQRTFENILRKIGIPHRGFHSLRHTFATRAIECGMDVRTLSEILGHKSVNITLNRYTHSLDEHKIAMMNKLGRMLDQ